MIYSCLMTPTEETKNQILHASKVRFVQYGFNKTTMNEIAEDCGMSAANIYRFFKSKNDIVAEMAIQFFNQTEETLREIVQRRGLTSIQRLEVFTLEMLKCTYDLFTNQPKIKEIIDFVSAERMDLVERHDDVKRSLVAEVLAEGKRNGEFDVEDIVATADVILKATLVVHCPVLMDYHPYNELEYMGKEIVKLLFRGLAQK